ncbi:MAG: helix-turn-helix transcriptional regulator [Propionicimonas sp.]
MSPRKSERIMNLAICLLMARRFIEKTQIRQVVEGYHDLSDAAFERTFERDKDELRAMGVPVETGSNNPLFPDEVGYRIRRKDFELPSIEFDSAETAALGLAATVWESATQAEQAVSALAKLRAAGVDPDPARLAGLAPSIGAREPAFASIWAATGDRTPIRFSYKGQPRHVEPWAMTYRRGAWYLLGRDRDREAPRMFKVARVDAPAQAAGKARSYDVPDVDLDAAWSRLEPRQADTEAIVAIRPGRAAELRRRGRPVEQKGTVPAGYEVYAVGYARVADLVGELCAHGADAVVLSPQRIRQSVITELKAVAGGLS